MKPIKFKECNANYAKDQPEYQTLPSLKLDTIEGEVISCWSLSFKERIRILFTGCIWMSIWTFNNELQPSKLSTERKDMFIIEGDKEYVKT